MMTPFKVVMRIFVLAILFCWKTDIASAQVFVQFSTPTGIAAGTACAGAQDVSIYAFRVATSFGAGANTLTQVSFTMSGTATVPGDVVQYQLWRDAAGTGVLLGTSTTTTFSGLSVPYNTGTTFDFFITADIAASPVQGRTIIVNNMTSANITMSTNTNKFGNGTGAGGTQTIRLVPAGITGGTTICEGATTTLSIAATGGTWSSSNSSIATINNATRVVTGGSLTNSGTTTITYSSTCGSTNTVVTVNANPDPITGPSLTCVGSSITLADPVTGGTWSSSNSSIATVNSSTGQVNGAQPGTTTITYSNGCGANPTANVTVNPNVTAISGNNTLCAGTTSPLSDAVAGGTWSSSNGAVATVDVNTGVVSAVADGNTTISYSNACNTVNYGITVTSANAGTITGATDVCNGGNISLTDNVAGGAWSSSIPGVATVDGSGTVFGASLGTTVISYTVNNICGTAVATHSVNVVNAPFPGVIIGPSNMCAGTFTILSNTVGGGVWSVNNGNATISGTGVLTAITPGSVIVSYTLSSACGPIATTKSITIFPVLNAGTISGVNNVCAGNTIFLTDNVSGGAWSSANPAVATVTGLGMVTGVSGGTTTISYLVTNGCGSLAATYSVTVNPTPDPGTIVGPSGICVGTFAMLTDSSPGGVWSSTNTNVATVDNSGLTFGTGIGTANIMYTVTNVCGTLAAVHPVTVSFPPNAGVISGPTSVCVGASIQLSETATGGAWSTSNGNASVSGSGLVTGIAAGTVDISYTSTTPCGTLATSYTITINPLANAGTITGPSVVCAGSTISLTDGVAGGTWSATIGVLSVDAFGNVTGLSAGSGTVTYTVTNVCNTATATHAVTVNAVPSVPAISGPSSVCIGATIHLDDAVTGGLWNTTSTAVSVVGAGSGIDVTGVTAGTALISYTVTDGGTGCSTTITSNINVNSLPVTTPITGSTNGCVGAMSSLSNATSGGVWSSDNVAVATVDAVNGNVTGVTTGTSNISYTLTNLAGCSASEVVSYTVGTVPAATPITGITTVCEGGTIMLSNADAGGVWSNTTGNATVSTVGMVTGVTAGTDNISYTVTNFCGSVSNVITVTVNPSPVVSPITSLFSSVCVGNTVMLDETAFGGAWSSSNAGVATVDGSGMVTGVSVGSATITYSLSNGFGCTTEQTINITVGPSMDPVALIPGGSATLCHGNPVNLQVVSTSGPFSYQWVTGTTPIPGATNSVYVANLAATYSVIVDNGTCAQLLGSTVVVLSPNPVINFTAPNTLYTSSFHSYQWYKDGVVIPGAVSSLIHTIGDGNYTVVVSDANGCTDTSAVYTIGIVAVGNTPAVQPVKIYPNPATSVLHIEAGVKVNATIMSVDGKMLISQRDATDVDIRSLASGMYMIMVYDENNMLISTARFVKSEQ